MNLAMAATRPPNAVRGGVACQSKPALTNSCLVKYLGGVQIDNGQGVAVEAAGSNKRLVAFNNDVEGQVGKFDLSTCWSDGPAIGQQITTRNRAGIARLSCFWCSLTTQQLRRCKNRKNHSKSPEG